MRAADLATRIVKRSLTLRQLHHIIQAAMGWKDYHLYEFHAGNDRFGEPDPDESDDETRPAAAARLSWLLRSAGDQLLYTYDFGDEWRHEVLLEDLPSASEYKMYPVCLAGRGACPPEDIGGPFAYKEYLELLLSEDEVVAEEARVILGRRFDPQRFA